MVEDKKKVLISVISNRGSWPKHFAISLIELINHTRKKYYVEYFVVSSCSVNHMRNRSALISINKGREARGFKFDYQVQLDDDMMYPKDFIEKFIEHDKDCVVGVACQRTPPFSPVQYKEFNGVDFKKEDNLIRLKGDEGLVKVGISGPVGMVIKTEVFDKLKYPYYQQIETNDQPSYIGGDVNFACALKDAKIDIWCDSSVSFPHCVGENMYADRGDVKFFN